MHIIMWMIYDLLGSIQAYYRYTKYKMQTGKGWLSAAKKLCASADQKIILIIQVSFFQLWRDESEYTFSIFYYLYQYLL